MVVFVVALMVVIVLVVGTVVQAFKGVAFRVAAGPDQKEEQP